MQENKSLLDALRNQISARPQVEARDTTQAADRLLTARSTGRSGQTTRGPQTTSSFETAANANTQTQLNNQTQANQIAAQDLGIQAHRQDQIQQQDLSDIAQRAKEVTQSLAQREEQIFSQLERDKDNLQSDQNQLNLEILGASLALKDDQYLYALENAGRTQRLDNDLDFKTSLQQAVFGDAIDLFKDQNTFNEIMNAEARDYAQSLAHMDIATAIRVAEEVAKGQAITKATTAVGNIATVFTSPTTEPDTFETLVGDSKVEQ